MEARPHAVAIALSFLTEISDKVANAFSYVDQSEFLAFVHFIALFPFGQLLEKSFHHEFYRDIESTHYLI